MKKKLLFFGYTMDMGGAEKVMLDFLKVLQPHYDIDLVLLQDKGVLMRELPEGIGVIRLRKGLLPYLLFRYLPAFRKRRINRIANAKDYAAAIGFMEGRSATWVADIRKNIRRLAWVHTDVDHFDIGISHAEAVDSYSKMDAVVPVSETARESFLKKYSIDPQIVTVLHNLVDAEAILAKAQEPVEPNDRFTFINVGRMTPPKRQDRLVEIARQLKSEGFRFRIQIIGSGSEEPRIREMIRAADVEDTVQLLGLKTNPYPYVKQADCFVLSSDFEGFGIAVKEAALLGTPVISTAVTGVGEVLQDGAYGILCDVSTEALCDAMRSVLESEEVLRTFRQRLAGYDCANEAIIRKLFALIEGQ